MAWLLEAIEGRVTRIDIANDLECETGPLEFATDRTNRRFRSGRHDYSETGETVYIGSEKSEAYVRVYRWYQPHPRSHLLRIEYVNRRDEAKNVLTAVLDTGVRQTSLSLGGKLGWRHASFHETLGKPLRSAARSETGQARTMRWLSCAVKPAIKRLLSQQILTAAELAELIGFPEQ